MCVGSGCKRVKLYILYKVCWPKRIYLLLKVHSLPSHARFSKKDLSEFKSVLKSDVITIEGQSIIKSVMIRSLSLPFTESCY